MALVSEAVLAALDLYIDSAGGSRDACVICDTKGDFLPQTRLGPLEHYRFSPEREADRQKQIVVRLKKGTMKILTWANRHFDESAKSFVERDWPDWLTGRAYDLV